MPARVRKPRSREHRRSAPQPNGTYFRRPEREHPGLGLEREFVQLRARTGSRYGHTVIDRDVRREPRGRGKQPRDVLRVAPVEGEQGRFSGFGANPPANQGA